MSFLIIWRYVSWDTDKAEDLNWWIEYVTGKERQFNSLRNTVRTKYCVVMITYENMVRFVGRAQAELTDGMNDNSRLNIV
jgi:hypothetical protein